METTEKIVEAYVRYVKGWATIPNIKCPGQHEIDLLAIDPVKLNRYHIESGVSISGLARVGPRQRSGITLEEQKSGPRRGLKTAFSALKWAF
jgi:hypothetical protein